jgi:hypothetical protein
LATTRTLQNERSIKVGAEEMKKSHYRIYPVNIPADLKDRISAIHAAAILKSNVGNGPAESSLEKNNKLIGDYILDTRLEMCYS